MSEIICTVKDARIFKPVVVTLTVELNTQEEVDDWNEEILDSNLKTEVNTYCSTVMYDAIIKLITTSV